MANKYETVLIVDPALGEEGVAAVVEKFKNLIAAGGTVENVEDWGKRKLAYEINGLNEGNYTLIDFHADPAAVAELDRVLRITDAVVRHMIVKRTDRD